MSSLKVRRSSSQQAIVFGIFVLMFLVFSAFLPGFLTTGNMLGLLQNVAILGILGLGMAIIVIGRGIDISMVAVLAVPAGLVLQMVQDGHSLPIAFGAALALALVFGLVNGWLVAYAEVPSLFTTLASGLFLAGLGQIAFFRLDIVQWSPELDKLSCKQNVMNGGTGEEEADAEPEATIDAGTPVSVDAGK